MNTLGYAIKEVKFGNEARTPHKMCLSEGYNEEYNSHWHWVIFETPSDLVQALRFKHSGKWNAEYMCEYILRNCNLERMRFNFYHIAEAHPLLLEKILTKNWEND